MRCVQGSPAMQAQASVSCYNAFPKGRAAMEPSMKTFAALVIMSIALGAPGAIVAKTKKVPVQPRTLHAPVHAAGLDARLIRRPHSPNPQWDVYLPDGRYVGRDPDPNVRLMLRKDRYTEY
jgi:hypothetical protein